jgi:nucleoside-diphosphate-sugar epimerase
VKALVTGARGFVGRHMVDALSRRGFDIAGPDLVDGVDCLDIFRYEDIQYDLVVHCAYHVGGRQAIDSEPRLLAKNLELDAQMFSWAVRTGQRRVLYFSSSAAYPVELQTAEWASRLTEDDIDLEDVAQPDARYGWAKLTGEQLACAARQSGLAVHVVRPFSGYGEDQSLDYPFPSIVRRAQAGDYTVWGPPGQTRDWIHIDDLVAGALAVVDAGFERPVNLCSGIGTEMGELMRLVAGDVHVTYQIDKPTGVHYRVGDPERLHRIYLPKISLAEGIKRALR